MLFRPSPKTQPNVFDVANGDPARATHIAAIDTATTYAVCRRWPQAPTVLRKIYQADTSVTGSVLQIQVPYFTSGLEVRVACGWTGDPPGTAGVQPLVLVGVSTTDGGTLYYASLRPALDTSTPGAETPDGSEEWAGTSQSGIGSGSLTSGHIPVSMLNRPQHLWLTWECNDLTIIRAIWVDFFGLSGEKLEVPT